MCHTVFGVVMIAIFLIPDIHDEYCVLSPVS